MHMPVTEITLKLIASKYAPESFEALMSVQNALIMLVRKCKELNDENKALVEGALQDTQVLKRNVLGMTSEQPKVYGPKGNMNQKENTSRILNKEA
jgi:flagellar biosynthesis/type III secretory pathway chaperone